MRSHPATACVRLLLGVALLGGMTARAQEVFPLLTLDGQALTNARPIEVSPVDILFKADGPVFKRVKRQDLPEGLKDKYPYDDAKAAEYEKEKVEKAKALREQQRREAYAALLRQEKELENRIEKLDAEMVDLQKELNLLNKSANRKPRSPARLVADQARVRKQNLISQQSQLQQQLKQVRASQAQYR